MYILGTYRYILGTHQVLNYIFSLHIQCFPPFTSPLTTIHHFTARLTTLPSFPHFPNSLIPRSHFPTNKRPPDIAYYVTRHLSMHGAPALANTASHGMRRDVRLIAEMTHSQSSSTHGLAWDALLPRASGTGPDMPRLAPCAASPWPTWKSDPS